MFKSVKSKASTEAASKVETESDDDSISLTSTVSGHDPEKEYEVEDILAEAPNENGVMHYLVDWSGFELHEATWEPESNLSDELKALWEETKAKHAAGELEPFDVQKYYDAQDKAEEDKAERHHRREAKRKRLARRLIEPLPDADRNSSEDEAAEDFDIEDSASGPAVTSRPKKQQSIFKGIPTPRSTMDTGGTASAERCRVRDETKRPGEGPAADREHTSLSSQRNQLGHPQSAGYPGTARKTSKQYADAGQKSKTKLANQVPPSGPTTVNKPPQAARKPLTAKKSTAQPAGNIFTGGKMGKARASLKDVMSDPTKEPKLFDRYRYRRILAKWSRDKEDIAPDISSLQLFDITKGPGAARRSSSASVQSPTSITPQETISATELPFGPPNPAAEALKNSETNMGPSRKKRKSVRFLDDDGDRAVLFQEPEPILVDSPVREDSPHCPSRPFRASPTTGPERSGLDQGHVNPLVHGSQRSHKKLIIGRSSVEVTFNGLPLESSTNYTWLADFLAREALEFKHTCFAKTVALQIGALIQEQLASGTIVSKGDGEPDLVQAAEYLTTSLLGLFSAQAEHNILIFPTKCEEWKFIPLGQDPTSPPGAALRYIIFSSQQDFSLLLPPSPPTRTPLPAIEDSERKSGDSVSPSDRELMIKRFFGFSYTDLLPTRPKPLDVHAFFLAIPPSREATMQALYHWLRACNPDCLIFTSKRAGSWAAFQDAADSGVVIIHETLAWSIRRFPNLSRRLIPRSRHDQYWCLSEPIHGSRLYPSVSVPETLTSPGDMRLTRLFPYRTAILLTPSFLVSEPRRAAEFFEWFISNWASTFHYRLVTAYNIHEYMLELAEEKYKARQDLLKRPDPNPEIAANLARLSSEDCKFRYTAAELATDLHLIRTAKSGPFGHDEDNSPLVYVDPSIDPNDEQSLVNWFGWWATLRADQFRKFHVVGSSETIKFPGSRKGERLVRIPKYTKVAINHPDAVLEVVQEKIDQVNAPAEGGPNSDNGVEEDGHKERENDRTPWSFRSDLIRSEDSASVAAYLEELGSIPNSYQCILYRYPISWLDLEMADHFHDFTSRWQRISDWFKFAWPFGGRTKFNTYIGFFYTIAEAWDPDNPPASRQPQRHPWIAIYRPVNLHMKPWTGCEIIIWDPAARTKFTKKQVLSERDLLFMQRQVIQHVREFGAEKNPGTKIDRLWLGGFDWPVGCNSRSPLDVTLLFLQHLLEEIKAYLPVSKHAMEGKGYVRLKLGSSESAGSRSPASNADSSLFADQETKCESVSMETDGSDGGDFEDDDEDIRVIFHPPRGKGTRGSRLRTKCMNKLYEEACLARKHAGHHEPAATHMLYSFPPTMDWYKEQKAEGRGFAHINIESWEGIFNLFEIGASSGKAERSERSERSASATASASDGRRESIGSS
ncbi:Chromo domain-containing protein 1 [Madurella mycetomatis]|uniref:Chromo domain-containing protein 1 n=1 Tax=Madurella mycetomatis TaxID=100816 RepID=A0A175WAW1_9PEZI|nr:Chromo domain-containing protein 1 [Madurella mycetomatis]